MRHIDDRQTFRKIFLFDFRRASLEPIVAIANVFRGKRPAIDRFHDARTIRISCTVPPSAGCTILTCDCGTSLPSAQATMSSLPKMAQAARITNRVMTKYITARVRHAGDFPGLRASRGRSPAHQVTEGAAWRSAGTCLLRLFGYCLDSLRSVCDSLVVLM